MTSGGNNFPGLSRTLNFNFQDQSNFPGLSRSWNFKEKNPGLSRRHGNPVINWSL